MNRLDLQHQKDGKARFDHIYDLPDPREYFTVLRGLDYQIPQHARGVFDALVAARRAQDGDGQVTVADLCCSYGINAALLRCDLTLGELYERYCSPELAGLSSAGLAAADADFFRSRQRERPPRFIGLDCAGNAVAYALQAGLLDVGAAQNLESTPPSDPLARALAEVDVVTVTGGIGYISERTFHRVLGCVQPPRRPWVAAFALRMVPYRPVAEALAGEGLVTERASRTFPQRRFADARERDYVLGELQAMGVDPAGREAEGWYHASFYLSRPAEQANAVALETLLDGLV